MSAAISMSTYSYKFEYTYKTYENFLFATVPFEAALELCSDYTDFAEAKKEIKAICDALAPLKEWETISTSDLERLYDISEKISPHNKALFKINDEWANYLE